MSASLTPQLLDVTLRDGGYVNAWQFPLPAALSIVTMLSRSGVPFIEVGYYRPRAAAANGHGSAGAGLSSYCSGAYLEALAGARGGSQLTVMIHLQDVLPCDYGFLAEHGVSCVRFVVSTPELPPLGAHVEAAGAAGLRTSVNLIRASERTTRGIVAAARAAEALGVDWLYVADSNGSMFPERVGEVFRAVTGEVGLPAGFHAHDSLQLAFANSLAAVGAGGRLLDSSLGGMGKGAGNLVTELITAYLKAAHGGGYNVSELTGVACERLGEWIRGDHRRRCESMLSALLDLNAEGLREAAAAAERAQRPLLLELESGLNRLPTGVPT